MRRVAACLAVGDNPVGNTAGQRNRLSGGAGDDWISSSHGRDTIRVGSGDDVVFRNCERIIR